MSEIEALFKERLAKYFRLTGEALQKVKLGARKEFDWNEKAHDFLDMSEMKNISEHAQKPFKCNCKHKEDQAKVVFDMAQRYFDDARHFEEKGDLITAFAALNYAHGWLDVGARLGLFDVKDNRLFMVDAE